MRPVEVGVEVGKLRVACSEEVQQLLVGVVGGDGGIGECEALEGQRVALLERVLFVCTTPSRAERGRERGE